jgi:putative FmdB family regulatory protein
MPLYVYVCQRCNERFERLVSMSRANEMQICPRCNANETRRALTTAATLGCKSTKSGFT